jgi:hypothetical protein
VIEQLVGDLGRFGQLADRVQGLVDVQVQRYRPHSSDWIVLPREKGFYLFSEDSEGQRRGREVVMAFLGPSLVAMESVAEDEIDDDCLAAGFVWASYLRRLPKGAQGADQMLSGLEDLAATVSGRSWRVLDVTPSHSDLLRDFRLALLRREDDLARRLFDQLRLDGHLSAENLRYLRIEYLAAFERWGEMRDLPHVKALVQSRRPKLVTESLLRMVWWTEFATPGQVHEFDAAEDSERVLAAYGPLLRSVRVPTTREGRAVCFVAAYWDDDSDRQQAILDGAQDAVERSTLNTLVAKSRPVASEADGPPPDLLVAAYRSGRYAEVIEGFLISPDAEHAEIAMAAVLDASAHERASDVLDALRPLIQSGDLVLGRRAQRDLEELEAAVGESCPDWVAWASRLASGERWPTASAVLRDNVASWPRVATLPPQSVNSLCDALIDASSGSNEDQLRASLDVLCNEAIETLKGGVISDYCNVVMEVLSEQENFSEMVRAAYSDLFVALLDAGPSARDYSEVLSQVGSIWDNIASPVAVPWAIGALESLTDAPCPDVSARTQLAVQMVEGCRRLYGRVSLRERVELEALAGELGLDSQEVIAREAEREVWSELDSKLVGIYSLLPHAASHLEQRLRQLCSVGEVRGNQDLVATPALRSLARRSDYLIVDTWHAAHQATGAIDAVRPREKQILPSQRGTSGFLRALEGSLNA